MIKFFGSFVDVVCPYQCKQSAKDLFYLQEKDYKTKIE